MLELFNYCPLQGNVNYIKEFNIPLDQMVKLNQVDGCEMFVFSTINPTEEYLKNTIGAHLRYWPTWVGFWRGDLERLNINKADQIESFGSVAPSGWLETIKNNIKEALKLKPQYLVWHISEANNEEIYSWKFKYTDREVIDASIEVFNSVSKEIPEDVTVLFENLWWPGLTLKLKEDVAHLINGVNKKNVGIMLDLGHLANTNAELKDQKAIVDYGIKVYKSLGEYGKYILGMHLSKSLSGEYVKKSRDTKSIERSYEEMYKHISNIDQHLPFSDSNLEQLVSLIKPKYLVHEVYYKDEKELAEAIKIQQKALGKCHEGRGDKHNGNY